LQSEWLHAQNHWFEGVTWACPWTKWAYFAFRMTVNYSKPELIGRHDR
jgi:hypothetical protein